MRKYQRQLTRLTSNPLLSPPERRRICAWALTVWLLGGGAALYAAEAPVWIDDARPTAQARELMHVFAQAEAFGLWPSDYALGLTASELHTVQSGAADAALQARFEAALTQAASRFVRHLHSGRIPPRAAGFALPAVHQPFEPAHAVGELARADDVRQVVGSLEPRPRPYHLLKEALSRYRQFARTPQLNALPALPSRSLRIGDEYLGAPRLRALLLALGDLDSARAAAHEDEQRIDEQLTIAVEHFQRRHGLEPDGVLGSRTWAALTTPFAQRVHQIELTLERWRWTTALQRPDIVVNIPQFMLYALPRATGPGDELLEMPVIVGQSYPHMRTPVFAAAIQRVIFQPYWDVPPGILQRELLPLIRKNPAYLARNDMEIVRGPGDDAVVVEPTPAAIAALARGELRLRQRPGPKNALGPVKFVLPNPYNVYLHATPELRLFERSRRAFSHGCIRVSKPAALAHYVLRNAPGDWSPEAIEAAMCGSQTLRVDLITPVRVLVFYGTAAATQSTGVMFFEDLYGYDRKLAALLAR